EVAAVTGGASGIGPAAAEAFAAVGAAVAIVDRDGDRAAAAASRITASGGTGQTSTPRVADGDAGDRVFADIAARLGKIDVLVNSAGTAIRRPAAELSREDWETVVAVNMTGVFLCTQAAARDMLAKGTPGRIINIASIMGLSGGGI